MQSKKVIVQGRQRKLSIALDSESLNIYVDNGEDVEPLHVVYWHIDEVAEDENVAFSMLNAMQLFYTNPQELIDRLNMANYNLVNGVKVYCSICDSAYVNTLETKEVVYTCGMCADDNPKRNINTFNEDLAFDYGND